MKKNEFNIFKWLTIVFFVFFMATLVLLTETEKESKVMEQKIDYLEFKVLNLEEDVEEYQEEIDILNYSVDTMFYW
jgi:peptidoglycan hydrolase CwlO-like protein